MNVRTRRRAAALVYLIGLILLSLLLVLDRGTSDINVGDAVACGSRPFLWDSVLGQRVTCDDSAGLWVEVVQP